MIPGRSAMEVAEARRQYDRYCGLAPLTRAEKEQLDPDYYTESDDE
jgi:hypothetical protein